MTNTRLTDLSSRMAASCSAQAFALEKSLVATGRTREVTVPSAELVLDHMTASIVSSPGLTLRSSRWQRGTAWQKYVERTDGSVTPSRVRSNGDGPGRRLGH